jgi:hypothetical protein
MRLLHRPLLAVALVALLAPVAAASELTKQQGVAILTLDGTPAERGEAHGRLLAKEVLHNTGELDRLKKQRIPDEKFALSLLEKFVFSEDESAELDGIVKGVREVMGEDVKVPGTERRFERRDLVGINTLADLMPLACSSFTVTGPRVAGGGTITARNLDYPAIGNIIGEHLVVVRKATSQHHAWATISWAGSIGCFTGMNDESVTASIHDVPTAPSFILAKGFTPRALGLRKILETTTRAGFAEKAADVLRGCRVCYGNNIHVSAPGSAVVLEWDPDQRKEKGVTIRAAENGAIVCTNHWRERKEAEKCRRFAALTKALEERAEPWTPKAALAALRLAEVKGEQDVTIHSAVFSLETRQLLVAFATDATHPAADEEPAAIDLGALMGRKAKKWY